MDWIDELEELCEKVTESIAEANKKLRNNGGALSPGDADYLDKLTHMLKSIKTTMAMDEYEDDYSNRSYASGGGRSYRSGGGSSYARGRSRNARRDSMGRYSREGGYSYGGDKEEMIERLRDIMEDAPDEKYRQEVQRLLNKMESM